MSTLTPPRVDDDRRPDDQTAATTRERIFRRRGSGDFSKPTLGGLIGRYALLLFVLVIVIGPFLWQLSTSFKGPQENIYSFPPNLIPREPTLQNYATSPRSSRSISTPGTPCSSRSARCSAT